MFEREREIITSNSGEQNKNVTVKQICCQNSYACWLEKG